MIEKNFWKRLSHWRTSTFAKKSGFTCRAWAFFLLLAGIKLFLVRGQGLFAIGNAKHDDQLFVKMADTMQHFKWLGDFNNLTLAKGPFYSMWMVLTDFLHIPLLFSQHLLYVVACLVLVLALKPLFSKSWPLFFIYAVVLFNPMNYTDGTATRVTREGVYQSLTLLVVALFIGLMLRLKQGPKNILFWSASAGIALSAFWLTREEGVWILPFAVPVCAYCIFLAWKQKKPQLKKRIALYALPFLMLLASIHLISAINYFTYRSYNVVEFKAPQFLDAYGALTRIKTDHWMRDVPVSAEQRMLAYGVSPTFSELKKVLEGNIRKGWTKISDENAPSENNGEIKGGWFMWALRDAVERKDFYSDGKTALEFYARMAEEINLACEKKELNCFPKRSSMNPPWNQNYNQPFLKALQKSIVFTATFKDFNPVPSASLGKEENQDLFREITNERFADGSSNKRIEILGKIGRAYQAGAPYLISLTFLIFLAGFFQKQFWQRKIFWINVFLLAAIGARMVIIAIIETTSFPAIGNQYVSPAYALVLLFMLLNWLSFFSTENSKKDEKE